MPGNAPANVKIVETTFASYCQRVSDSLGIVFEPTSPYKLCDLKPALGHIHQDELDDFDFWAFGDLDLVYGDLRGYFTADRLSRYDVYSTHQRRISGHCCLLRNVPLMREAFMRVPNWRRLLSDAEHMHFDESAFSRLFVRHKNWPTWLVNIAKPLHFWACRIENIEAFSTPYVGVRWIDGSNSFPSTWYWNNGRVTNDQDGDRQFPYFHFMIWKRREWLQNDVTGKTEYAMLAASGRWRISIDGFSEGV